MYRALIDFIDMDNKTLYKKGDKVNVKGKTKERLKEMTTINNRAQQVLIEKETNENE